MAISNKKCNFVNDVKKNLKDMDVFFRVQSTEPFGFPIKWKKPRKTGFTNEELIPNERNIVTSLRMSRVNNGLI